MKKKRVKKRLFVCGSQLIVDFIFINVLSEIVRESETKKEKHAQEKIHKCKVKSPRKAVGKYFIRAGDVMFLKIYDLTERIVYLNMLNLAFTSFLNV